MLTSSQGLHSVLGSFGVIRQDSPGKKDHIMLRTASSIAIQGKLAEYILYIVLYQTMFTGCLIHLKFSPVPDES